MQRIRRSFLLKLALLASVILPLVGVAAASAFVQAAPGEPIVTLGGAIGTLPVESPPADRTFTWNVANGGAGVGQISVTLFQNSDAVASHSIANAVPVGVVDFSDLGTGWFKIDVTARDAVGANEITVSRQAWVFSTLSTMAGNRAQETAFGTPIEDLPVVGLALTQGMMGRNPDGPTEPYFGSVAYRYFSNPNYNPGTGTSGHVAPYAMSSTVHTAEGPLSGIAANGLRYSFIGQTLASDVTEDLRALGSLSLNDSRLYEGNNFIYFRSNRGGPVLHNMERRMYVGGEWQILQAGEGGAADVVIGSGTILSTQVFLDYTSFGNTGYSVIMAHNDEKLLNAAVTASGSPYLIVEFGNIQSPLWSDDPEGAGTAEQYAVYGLQAKLGLLAPFGSPEPLPTLSINDVSVLEGDSGTTNAVFTVTLSAASADIVSVVYTTYALTATAGTDYGFMSASLSFLPGETIKQVIVAVNGDTDAEGNETFRVLLTSPGNATISDAEGIGTITEEAGEGAPAAESAPPFDGTYPLPDGYCICTPVVMNTDTTATETWFARAAGTEMDIDIIAHAVNTVDPETVEVTITSSAGTSNYTVSYTAAEAAAVGTGFEKTVTANLTGLTVGEIVRLDVTTPAPTPATQPHYRLKFWGADLAGINSPSFPSLEEVPMRWLVHANAGEQVNLDFFTAGSVVLPNPATSVDYRLYKPSGVLHSSGTVAVGAGDEIVVPAIAGADAGMWMVEFMSNGHVRMAKTSNIDMGLYVSWNSGGFARKTVQINKDGALATGTSYTVKILQPFLVGPGVTEYILVDTRETSTGTTVFEKLLPGNYRVEVVSPSGVSTPAPQDDVLPCDGELLNTFETTTTASPTLSSISDKVWVDVDADGIQDGGEPGLANVTVRLLNASDAVLATTVTDANGLYTFDNLAAGDYKVAFVLPASWAFTAKDVGGNDAIDSDANPGTGKTDLFALAAGVTDTTRDAGLRKADVRVTKTADPTNPVPGQQVFYRVTVTNNGPTAATNVVVTDTLPANAALLTLNPGAPVCATSGQTITCTYVQINAGEFRIIEVNTNPWPTSATSMNNTVSVTANEPDPNMTNNSAGVTTPLVTAPPVAVPGVSFWGLALLTVVFGGLLYLRGRSQPRTR